MGIDVAVVEDHVLVADTLRVALAGEALTAVVLGAHAVDLLPSAVATTGARLVLLDLDLGRHGDSTPAIAPMVDRGIRVLVVSATADRARISAALDAGAFGFHAKNDGLGGLLAKVHAALTSAAPLDAELRVRLRGEVEHLRRSRSAALAGFDLLTDRERDTLLALSRGLSVHEIAAAWVLSEATVRSHVRGVLAKLGVSSQVAAVAAALRTGWLASAAA